MSSAVGFLISEFHLIPTKIPALGIDIPADSIPMTSIVAVVIGYYFVYFCYAAYSDIFQFVESRIDEALGDVDRASTRRRHKNSLSTQKRWRILINGLKEVPTRVVVLFFEYVPSFVFAIIACVRVIIMEPATP